MIRVEPVRFIEDKDLAGVPELDTRGKVVWLWKFPTRFNNAVYATESGLWRLYLWRSGLFKRRVK